MTLRGKLEAGSSLEAFRLCIPEEEQMTFWGDPHSYLEQLLAQQGREVNEIIVAFSRLPGPGVLMEQEPVREKGCHHDVIHFDNSTYL